MNGTKLEDNVQDIWKTNYEGESVYWKIKKKWKKILIHSTTSPLALSQIFVYILWIQYSSKKPRCIGQTQYVCLYLQYMTVLIFNARSFQQRYTICIHSLWVTFFCNIFVYIVVRPSYVYYMLHIYVFFVLCMQKLQHINPWFIIENRK